MKVMVLGPTLLEPNTLTTMVCLGGHQAIEAADARSASAAAGAQAPNVCFLGTATGEEAAVEEVKKLRAMNPKLVIVLFATEASESLLTRLYDAGLDLDLPETLTSPYLLTRLRVLERQFQIPTVAKQTGSIPISKTGAIPVMKTGSIPVMRTGSIPVVMQPPAHGPLTTFLLSTAWQQAQQNLKEAAGKFLTLPATTADVASLAAPLTHGKQILLSSPEHQIELRAALGIELASAKHLAMHLFGADEDELAIDMLGELANIFMGTLKSSFSALSLAVTGGLPADVDVDEVLRPSVTYKHQESFIIVLDSARLVVHLGMRSKANVFLPPGSLEEGMILAKDLHNGRGMLLLSKGTRLSLSMIQKVKTVSGAAAQIEVMAP